MVTQPLFQPLPVSIRYNSKAWRVNLSFDRVLEMFEALQDNDLDDGQKVEYALWLLIGRKIRRLSGAEQAELLELIRREYIDLKPAKSMSPRTFDFLQDAPYIYAAFRQTYGIDLFAEHGRLHWWAFVHLFLALPDDTMIKKIIDIRTRPIPKSNKHNADHIRALLRAKDQYRLAVSQEERDQQFAAGLRRMFATLEGMR